MTKPTGRGAALLRLLFVIPVALLALTAVAAEASAHVTVIAPGVSSGASDAAITFRVPDESAKASTVGLKLALPTATPLLGVLVEPQPGWTAKIIQTALPKPIHTDDGDVTQIVSEIDWTATGAGIAPGYFTQFTIIAGKLPDKLSALTFKVVQRYSDAKTVSWIQVAAAGSTAPLDFPAPVLHLTPATGTTLTGTAATGTAAPTTPTSPATPSATGDTASKSVATTGVVLGALGVVLGAAALALAVARRRRPDAPAEPT